MEHDEPTNPTRSHYAKGVARRDEILDTTVRLMAERGFRKTSIRAIGRELGLEPAHILYYFNTREKLFEAVIKASDDRYLVLRPGVDSLFEAWLQMIDDNARHPGLVQLYTAFAAEAADHNHPSRPFFQKRWEILHSAVEHELARGDADGRYRLLQSPRDAATALVAYSDGLQLHWLVDRSLDMSAAMRIAIDATVGAGSWRTPPGHDHQSNGETTTERPAPQTLEDVTARSSTPRNGRRAARRAQPDKVATPAARRKNRA